MPPRPLGAAGAALALAVGLALAGCTAAPEPEPTPTNTAAAPIFASDEAAFAAAEAAYGRYVEAAFAVSRSGGADTSSLEPVAMGEALESALTNAAGYAERGHHTVGTIEPRVVEKIQYFETQGRGAVVQVSICEDISDVEVVDEGGVSVVREGRTELLSYSVTIEGTSAETLKVSERWLGGKFCL